MIKIAQIWNNNFNEFANELEQSTDTISHIILDFLLEVRYIPVDRESFDRIINFAFANDIPVTILTPWDRYALPLIDFQQLRYARINMIHWETFWFRRTYNVWTTTQNLTENLSKGLDIVNQQFGKPPLNFKFPYITLNNIAKKHRCLFMDLLSKHDMIDVGAIVWRDILHSCNDIRDTFPEGVTDSVYSNFQYQYWKPKRMFLDQGMGLWLKNQETLPIEFHQSFMQLVTESDDEAVFFSEKTATPILFNKPFLVASCAGFHRNLESQGFALYNELFDYSFDGESNIHHRYEGLIENVKRYASIDNDQLNNIYSDIFEKLVHNKQHALKLVNDVPQKVQQVIDMLKRENVTDYPGPLNIFL